MAVTAKPTTNRKHTKSKPMINKLSELFSCLTDSWLIIIYNHMSSSCRWIQHTVDVIFFLFFEESLLIISAGGRGWLLGYFCNEVDAIKMQVYFPSAKTWTKYIVKGIVLQFMCWSVIKKVFAHWLTVCYTMKTIAECSSA